MTSERDNCGLSSLLPVSCRDRAEAFARNLQNRLSTLGSQDSSSEERSWLGPHERPVTLSQPILNLETQRYVELDSLQSPCSPQEEMEDTEFNKLLSSVSLREDTNGECRCPSPKLNGEDPKYYARTNGIFHHQSVDSDNEVFYDLDDDPETQPYLNGLKTSESSKSIESETGIDVNSQGTSSSNPSDTFATSLDCTPQPSLSDDLSTLSLGDECSIVGASSIITEEDYCEGCEINRELQNKTDSRNKETDQENSNNVKGNANGEVVNGTDDSETYVSVLTVHSELVVECRINSEENTLEEVESRITNGSDTTVDEKEDDDNDDDFIPRVRRCSSLKTGKTPPGTPGRKKIVRFADVLGLDLADVRTFLDEVPKVPKSAYNDLSDADLLDGSDLNTLVQNAKYHGVTTDRILIPQFDQPAGLPNFLDLVRDNQVCLENALVEDPILFLIKGTVRVRNLDFHKSVHIRYTLDSWRTFSDVQATYVCNSCDGFSDTFSFKIYAHTLTVGQKLEFAVRFQCKGCQYWDSNKGRNYNFQCLPSAASSTAVPISNHGLADWGASFY